MHKIFSYLFIYQRITTTDKPGQGHQSDNMIYRQKMLSYKPFPQQLP